MCNLLANFQKGGGLTGSQFLEGVAGKDRGELLQGGRLHVLQKKKGGGGLCKFKRGLGEKEGGVFEGELIPQCTLCLLMSKKICKSRSQIFHNTIMHKNR